MGEIGDECSGLSIRMEHQETKDETEDAELIVTITLTKNEWNESLNAMKILKHFARKNTNQNEKRKENSSDFQIIKKSIDTLFKHLLSKGSKRDDIYSTMNNLTSNEFETILNQIDNDNNNDKDNRENKRLKQQFCQSFDQFGTVYYKISSLSSIVNDYELIYRDFVSINNELIDNKLKRLLLKHSNNKQDVDFLYNKMIKTRNICSFFPFKSCQHDFDVYNSDYIELMNRFNTNNNDELKMFCILYNCIAGVLVAGDDSDSRGGFDQYIHNMKI